MIFRLLLSISVVCWKEERLVLVCTGVAAFRNFLLPVLFEEKRVGVVVALQSSASKVLPNGYIANAVA